MSGQWSVVSGQCVMSHLCDVAGVPISADWDRWLFCTVQSSSLAIDSGL